MATPDDQVGLTEDVVDFAFENAADLATNPLTLLKHIRKYKPSTSLANGQAEMRRGIKLLHKARLDVNAPIPLTLLRLLEGDRGEYVFSLVPRLVDIVG